MNENVGANINPSSSQEQLVSGSLLKKSSTRKLLNDESFNSNNQGMAFNAQPTQVQVNQVPPVPTIPLPPQLPQTGNQMMVQPPIVKSQNPSVPQPPLLNSIPPPPKHSLNLPPIPVHKIENPSGHAGGNDAPSNKPMTLAEQLALQKTQLKEAQKERTNMKVINMSDKKKIELQTQLAHQHMQQQLDQRKKLLNGRAQSKDSSDDEASDDDKSSDESGW